ncbi:MAG: phytanoyl-CoA dioxygenase family protein [Planctomycetes bacterium]|nr:phytanoyl-CoA dioxygenase family protein [Planctomycetota bacterium]
MPLSDDDLRRFVEDGYVRLGGAVPADVVAEVARAVWAEAGCDPAASGTWTRPVVRLGDRAGGPFTAAAQAPALHAAFDALVGPGRWRPRGSLGAFVLRFPSPVDPADTGWHVDASFPGDDPADYLSYRVNVRSRGRALLVLLLLSDVGEDDAPTRLRAGSHLDVARLLAPHGDAGLGFMALAERLGATERCPEVLAAGPAGTAYLCHPFLAHAGQAHRGGRPRLLAQPALLPAGPGDPADGPGPVAEAIRRALP